MPGSTQSTHKGLLSKETKITQRAFGSALCIC